MASIIKIDGVEMPAPSSFKPLYKDYDSKNSGRSESMIATRDIVRSDVRKISFTWIVQTPDLRTIREAIRPPELEVTVFDINQPESVQYSTMKCYAVPTREPEVLRWDDSDPEKTWWSFSTSFTEY